MIFILALIASCIYLYFNINLIDINNISLYSLDQLINQFKNFQLIAPVIAILFIALGVDLLIKKRKKTDYGLARFANLRIIKKMGLLKNKEGILLGYFKNKIVSLAQTLSIMCFAPPGTGKTAGLVIPILLTLNKRSVYVNDPKGELFEITSKYRSQFSKIIVFDPLNKQDIPESLKGYYNLLQVDQNTRLADYYNQLSRVASLFFYTKGNEDSHWNDIALRSNIVAGIEQIEQDNPFDEDEEENESRLINFIQIYMQQLVELKGMPDSDYENWEYDIVIGAFSNFADSEEKEFANVVSTFNAKLDCFFNPYIKQSLSKSTFSAQTLRKELTTLYIIISQEDKDVLQPILRAILEDIVKKLLSKKVVNSQKIGLFKRLKNLFKKIKETAKDYSILFLIDEIGMMGKLDTVIESPSLSRSYRFNFLFIAQDMNQLIEIYGQYKAESINSTCAIKYILTQNNFNAAAQISKYAGQFTRTKETGQKTIPLEINKKDKSINVAEEGHSLVTDQDIMNLKFGQAYIFVQSFQKYPLKITVPLYFKNRELNKRAGIMDHEVQKNS